MRRFLPLFAFLLLAALLFVGVRMNSGKDTSAIPSPLIGKPAPEFSLPVLGETGRTLAKKDFLGKPYLLNVWGSWCPNCRVEHPVISALARSGKLRVVGHSSGFSAKEKKELVGRLAPYETGERGSADPSRWKPDEELEWVALRPELVVEITYDHASDGRIRHGTKVQRWREDKAPRECLYDQLEA